MSTIYLSQDGSVLSKDGGRLIVKTKEQEVFAWPKNTINNIVVMGNVQITHAVIMDILERNGSVVYLDKAGTIKGCLGKNIHQGANIVKQSQAYTDMEKRLLLAKNILYSKLTEQKNLLIKYNKQLKSEAVQKNIIKIKHFMKLIDKQVAVDKLLGIEGIAAKAYYDCFEHILHKSEFTWKGRNRRPPQDPVNSMLSFAYCLLAKEVKICIMEKGLQPSIGYLHALDNYRESLVYDVMEAFRTSAAERFVFKCINLKKFALEDFCYKDGKCVFTEAARKRFVCEYDEFSRTELDETRSVCDQIKTFVGKIKKLILS